MPFSARSSSVSRKRPPAFATILQILTHAVIDEFSLQTLVDISKHPALSHAMTHLIIGLDEVRASQLLRGAGLCTFAEWSQWRDASIAQANFLSRGDAVNLLSQALGNLPNLETIDIRDFNSKTRYRDAVPGQDVPEWRSYGSSRYEQWPRESKWLMCLSDPIDFLDNAFIAVLVAAARSGTPVKNLELILRNRRTPGPNRCRLLQDYAFSALTVPGSPVSKTTLAALTKLHLDLDARSSSTRGSYPSVWPRSIYTPRYAWFDPSTMYLRRFLALTPNVSWLRLNFPGHIRDFDGVSKLITWLALSPYTIPPPDAPWNEGNPAPVFLPLQRLDLGQASAEEVTFCALLKKFSAHLEDIRLRNTWLRSHMAVDPLAPDSDCVWARLIRNLPRYTPKLKMLELTGLDMFEGSKLVDGVTFAQGPNPREYSVSIIVRIGDITRDMNELADKVLTHTQWDELMRRKPLADGTVEDFLIPADDDDEEEEEEGEEGGGGEGNQDIYVGN
jgi:hypothetical protein